MSRFFLVFIALSACIPPLEKPLMRDDPGQDFDGDGFTELEGDCDDLSQLASPAGDERCDGVDNDCDGVIDGDAAIDRTLWYADEDSDGFGDANQATKTCERPAGWVDNADDCDDTNADRTPNTIWYADQDRDGFGDENQPIVQCHPANHFVQNTGDCDDTSDAISPDALEHCWDGVDQNCDGLTPACLGLSDLQSANTQIDALIEGDSFGASVIANGARLWIGAPSNEGHVYGFSVTPSSAALTTDDASFTLNSSGIGAQLAPFGASLLASTRSQQLYLWQAPFSSGTLSEAAVHLGDFSDGLLFCPGVDLNGDGDLDLVVADNGGLQVFFGPINASLNPPSQRFDLPPSSSRSVALICGTFDDDAYADVLFSDAESGGTVRRYQGGTDGLSPLDPLTGADAASELGYSLSASSTGPLFIGAPGQSAVFTLSSFTANEPNLLIEGPIGSRLGEDLWSGLDLNTDGRAELLVYTPHQLGYFFDVSAPEAPPLRLNQSALSVSLRSTQSLLTDLDDDGSADLVLSDPSAGRVLIHWRLQP